MNTPEVVLPSGWESTVVSRHLENPYSDAALAEPRQDFINVGPVDLNDLPSDPRCSLRSLDDIKQPKEAFDPMADAVYGKVHAMFFSAAQLVLGSRRLLDARVEFLHARSHLPTGGLHTLGVPHIDGLFPEPDVSAAEGRLAFWGMAVSATPTRIVHGGYERRDFRPGRSGLDKKIVEYTHRPEDRSAVLAAEEIPINRLLLLGPVVVHFAQSPMESVPMRHMVRWRLYL